MELCRDKVFILKSKVRTNLVATESNYVTTNFLATEMRFDSNFVASERNHVAVEFGNNNATERKHVATLN